MSSPAPNPASAPPPPPIAHRVFHPKTQLVAACVAGALLLAGLLLHLGGGEAQRSPTDLSHILSWGALAIGLVYGGKAALEAARKQLVDIDVLMVVAAVLAAAIGAPAEGALLLFLFILAGALEDLALARTTRSVEALSKLIPTSAQRFENGDWAHVPPEQLVPGDRIRILPGEQVPTDAKVTVGRSSINQASITGESRARDVHPGDALFAGTVNVGSPIEAEVTKPASESALQKILHLVTEAQQQREPVQQLIDRVSRPYAMAVFAVAAAVFFIWWAMGHKPADAAYTAIALLIVLSPCALVIATPTATLAGISRAARGGVLFKGGKAIERLARLSAVCFDKTGTLTIGKPVVQQIITVGWSDERSLLAVARALEQTSTHPIAEAIINAAKERGVEPAELADVHYVAGRGIVGEHAGKQALLGSLAHTRDAIPVCFRKLVEETLAGLQHRGLIVVTCVYDQAVGIFILADAVRPGAECLVERLHALGVRPVVMLTGDNQLTAATVANQLKLDEFHADLMPQNKVELVKAIKARVAAAHPRGGAAIGVIGDGVNDAPALALADAAIAIGSIGSDAALENADTVLLSDDLSAVPWAVSLARRVRRTIAINITFALSAIALMAVSVITASLLGVRVPLWMGVVGHEGGTLLVVAHSLLILGARGVPLCPRAGAEGGGKVEIRIDGRTIAA